MIFGSLPGDKTDMYGPFGAHVNGTFLYVGRVWRWRCNSVSGEITTGDHTGGKPIAVNASPTDVTTATDPRQLAIHSR